MELKDYQKKTLNQIKAYLEPLSTLKEKNDKQVKEDPELSIDFPQKAWEKVKRTTYISKKNGLGEYLPDFYLKIPTGGGKTLLACHSVDLINRVYLKKQTGIILWIVPTTQIYYQTIGHLKNREHPYRQVLDVSSGGRTLILEKTEKFTPDDVQENLVVMMLMLPSANRLNKEVLKIFKDSGGFTEFFPSEDDREGNEKFLNKYPNLDCFSSESMIFGKVVKTSLGNTLKTLKPVIIIDEGHKAYSEGAQSTIRNFNPAIIVELSATPPERSNKLVEISGQELNREEMIKLDMHIKNKSSLKWQDVILSAVEKRTVLEKTAKEYESNTGEYIRPICLIQVERTGADQKGTRYVHSEDVKEYLIKQCGISENEIAIKSSEKDELNVEGVELLSKNCEIRYIITKHALQEGWDCAFAYVLAVLTNPSSQLSITQLVGRILRQPNARKTKIKELDESYIFCHRPKASEVLHNIKSGFEEEGLGDIAGCITVDEGDSSSIESTKPKTVGYREKFKHFKGKVYLPKFVIQEKNTLRDLSYDMDILGRIDWASISLNKMKELSLIDRESGEEDITVTLSKDRRKLIDTQGDVVHSQKGIEFSRVFITRQLIDIVPNPWIAYEIGQKALKILFNKYKEVKVINNVVFIIEELHKLIESEKDRLAEGIFKELIDKRILCFLMPTADNKFVLKWQLALKNNQARLNLHTGEPLQRSLFEYYPAEDFNGLEKEVAWYLDEQDKLLWWYRNLVVREDYSVQGWRKYKIYPDFVFTKLDTKNQDDYNTMYVIETKGLHLENEDTKYKRNVFDFCNYLVSQKDSRELELKEPREKYNFQVISEKEWKNKINSIFKN
ncbi:MAG: restriction endonuclease subunit R [Elusimicrobia bacterium CG1_02_37_114]|nr:MAG: restriction endonuclease subunit R [Elusimicrobia bacterium CG1_02_37_114]PIV53814.1 MAG: restriction endonuclease subunit R [Elusimicrobia bacterium CG02_land_8_20_14_3_00_37_13]PIZ12771.1 MAG: restriction endonuclease subunit R [Elusimicrobia bacterium CG_4_10_14_0_8_um_filter_37_32]